MGPLTMLATKSLASSWGDGGWEDVVRGEGRKWSLQTTGDRALVTASSTNVTMD